MQPVPTLAAPLVAPLVAHDGQLVVNSGGVLVVTVDKDGEENTELVPVNAQAGYTVQHTEAVFVSDLPRYRLPRFERGKYRAFEVSGDSMEPTLNHNDIVVCSYVDNWRLLIPNEIYVVVTSEAVMLKRIRKRIASRTEEVLLHSDNPHCRPYPVDSADIMELWRVRGYISTYLPSTPDVTVERLWEVIDKLGFDKVEVLRHLEEDSPSDAPL
ncbi:S24 family peptidase [Hymenobacter yonginensis]|uniref:S24 family peptidase n=1 Tax=Hymenobacter yonginensis TaxID=748197 RepID=A0ABY7PNZ1_9BACT|nr:S24 family peptidase [Hymenobacter yonginensis]WBO84476.1 S24 family peptidase [Hymenobacter yonginensis]